MLHPDIIRADATFRARSDAARKRISTIPKEDKEKLERISSKRNRRKRPCTKKALEEPEVSKLSELREKFPNMGKSWSEEDDELLTGMFKDNVKTSLIAKNFGSKAGAITKHASQSSGSLKTTIGQNGIRKRNRTTNIP
jgi:hypothetical protein